jgi:hypothetical protein
LGFAAGFPRWCACSSGVSGKKIGCVARGAAHESSWSRISSATSKLVKTFTVSG